MRSLLLRSVCILILLNAVQFTLRSDTHLQAAAQERTETTESDAEYSEQEQRQIQLAERFLSILTKNPRRGTALDRVYGHHIEFGTLDSFLESLHADVKATPSDGEKWMLLGLFESQRGEDAAAVDAFKQAEKHRPDDAMAPYYLSQSLLRIGENQAAVDAMQRAIDRNPPRADLLEIFQQLGRVHQRAQRTEEALAVWKRLEELFPGDPRVLEQIAVTMAEEGQSELALPRYEQLATLVRDDYRRTTYRVAAAELKIKTNRRAEGIDDLEAILNDLNPDGWLYRDVRRRIEDVFLRSSDQDSLVKYYENWLATHPDDVEAMARLASFLSSSARVPEATEWMEKALKLAPSRSDLRTAFIKQLVDEQRYVEAAEQYELLANAEPANTDFLRDWGKLVLRDPSQPLEKRQAEATRIWNLVLDRFPEDALVHAQIADLFRGANMNDRAMELYKQAVTLSPSEPQYREYLGEFYHIQKQTELALQTWAGIAAAPQRTADNLARVAEVYNSFGYADSAVAAIAEACALDPKDFPLQIQASDYHSRSAQYQEALKYVAAAEVIADNDEQRETALAQRIEVYQTSGTLDDEIDLLSEKIIAMESPAVDDWHRLARYNEVYRDWAEANRAIDAALKVDPTSIAALTTAARISEAAGDYGRAAELSRSLAATDRRSRDDHLMNVARLEMQLGRADEAIAAAQELIVAAPGNTDNYEFFAQLCFRLGRQQEGLNALRKAVRINPNEPHLIMSLGAALATQLETREAIEVYWRAFEKTDEIDDRTSLMTKLVPLYEQINQFEQLIARLERDRREEDQRRSMTICLAQAYQTAGDFATARRELESLLSEDTRDTNLLQQLAKLCQASGDNEAAIGYQRQLVAIAPGHETEYPLAGMLQQYGDRDEASEIFVRLTQREEDPVRLMRSLDSLLNQGSYEAVVKVVEPLLSQQRDDWELLYREAVAWASQEKIAEASSRFERLLSINKPQDSLGRAAEERMKQARQKARSDNLRGLQTTMPAQQSPLTMLAMSSQVQQATGLSRPDYYRSSQTTRVWTPDSFGVARMAAYGWLLKFEQDKESVADDDADDDQLNSATLAETVAAKAESPNAPREAIYDWMYVARLSDDNEAIFDLGRRLAKQGGDAELRFFLSTLATRGVTKDAVRTSRSGEIPNAKTPLSDDDLELMMLCYESLNKDTDAEDALNTFGGQIVYASDGQAYMLVGNSYQPIAGLFRGGGQIFFSTILEELKLAGRETQVQALIDAQLEQTESAAEWSGMLALMLSEKNYDAMPKLYSEWVQQSRKEIRDTPIEQPSTGSSRSRQSNVQTLVRAAQTIQRWIGQLAAEEEHQRILEILEGGLTIAAAEAERMEKIRALVKRQGPQPNYQNQEYQQYYYGETTKSVQFLRAINGEYVHRSAILLARQVYENFKQNDVLEDLYEFQKKRVAEATDDSAQHERLLLAEMLWWNDEKEEAISIIEQVAITRTDDSSFQDQLSLLYAQQGDLDRALDIVDAIEPRDQETLKRREMQAINLAERLGDIDRARTAAERLFGLRLKSDEQLSLVGPMRRLGLNEMADAVVSRAEQTAGNQPESLASLMLLYRGQGKMDEAKQLAHVILRRTSSPISALATATRNPNRYQSSSNTAARPQALALLQQTGELNKLIEQLTAQIERSPKSLRFHELLVEYYEADGKSDLAAEALTRAIEVRPDAVGLRSKLADTYSKSGKLDQACDEYLEIMRRQPDWISDDFYSIRNVFQRANRIDDILKVVSEIDLRSFRQPYYIIDLATNLLRQDANSEIAIQLIEKCYDAFPQYRQNLISNLGRSDVWKSDKIFELAKKMMVPTLAEIKLNPWVGVDDVYSYSGDGTVNSAFSSVTTALSGTDKMNDLLQTVASQVEASPEWIGGKCLLAIIDSKSGNKDAGRERLAQLLDDPEKLKTIPTNACWILAQELDAFEETRELATRMLEKAIDEPSQNRTSQLQYSPVIRLVKLYANSGRKQQARDLILRNLNSSSTNTNNDQYEASQNAENSQWAAGELDKMGFAIDAVRLYQRMLSDPERLKLAAGWNGREEDYHLKIARSGLMKSMESLESVDATEAVEELLAVEQSQKPGEAVLNLMLITPQVSDLPDGTFSSPFIDLLVTLSKQPKIAEIIDARLLELHENYPDDLSIAITMAMVRKATEADNFLQAVQMLSEQVGASPLEEIVAGRRPNTRQRQEAAISIPLWLLAADLVSGPLRDDAGEALANRAVEAAKRQIETDQAIAILFDWGERLADQGDLSAADQKWSELLAFATKRPARNQSANSQANGQAQAAISNLVSPLTNSQFNAAMLVAEQSARRNLADLSQRAVQEALRGGLPVEDLKSTASSNRGSGAVVFYSSMSAAGVAMNPSDTAQARVAKKIEQVVKLWRGEGYQNEPTYKLLKSLALPESRAEELFLYPDSASLMSGRVSSLGAMLIDWAARQDKLQELDREIAKRAESPPAKVAALVMRTLIALAAEDESTAKAYLTSLAETAQQDQSPTTVSLACHAALPAAEKPELEETAIRILKLAVLQDAQTKGADRTGSELVGALARRVNQYTASHGGADEVRQYFETMLTARQADYARYSGDYGLYRQWQDTAKLADEAASGKLPTVALDFMGRAADMSVARYSIPSMPLALASTIRHSRSIDAEKRFQWWADWTLPNENRNSLRMIVDRLPNVDVPDVFKDSGIGFVMNDDTVMLSNLLELVDAAKAAGKLDSLAEQAQSLVDAKVENSPYLLALALIHSTDSARAEAHLEEFFGSTAQRIKRKDNNTAQPSVLPDVMVYLASLDAGLPSSESLDRMEQLDHDARSNGGGSHRSLFRTGLARKRAERLGASVRPGDSPELKHWTATTLGVPGAAGVLPWWFAEQDQVTHLSGSWYDVLMLNYPIIGDFIFEVDCYLGDYGECDAGYGGVIVEAQQYGSQSTVRPIAGHERIRGQKAAKRDFPDYGRVRIESVDGKMRYYLNGYLAYEEPLSGTSPWVMLGTDGNRASVFRNPHFIGDVTIADQVELFSGNSMDSWNTTAFGETQPRHRMMQVSEDDLAMPNVRYHQEREGTTFDWETKDGVLIGRSEPSAVDEQSWVFYQRPLLDGETFAFEFYYSPDVVTVAPSIGQTALMLKPDGVKSHLIISNQQAAQIAEIESTNTFVDPNATAADSLPLVANDWNAIQMTLQSGELVLSLNGDEVYRTPFDGRDSRFGLFHYKNHEVKVRGATLTGDWESAVDSQLLASSATKTAADYRVAEALLRRAMLQPLAGDVVRKARSMDNAAALDYLTEWVLPSDTHGRIRVDFQYASPEEQESMPRFSRGLDRVLCPALEMLTLAKQLGKLEEIRDQIVAAEPEDAVEQRNRTAVLACTLIENGDLIAASEQIGELYTAIEKGLPARTRPADRQAELVVAMRAAREPQLWANAKDLLIRMQRLERDGNTSSHNGDWQKTLDGAIGAIEQYQLGPDASDFSELTQWAHVPYSNPKHRGAGYQGSTWNYHRGSVAQLPAEYWSQLFFQSPLRGRYEITARMSTYGYSEAVVAVGMHAADPKYDLSGVRKYKVMHSQNDIVGRIELPVWDDTADFRVVVDGNRVTTYTNGVKIHEENFSTPLDPWVIIQANEPGYFSTVRDVQITGTPEIPDAIDLIDMAGWAAWRADEYNDWHRDEPTENFTPYTREGEEMVGHLRTNLAASPLESVMQYARPMLEDGEIEFESYYVPGEFEIHPAVGKLALLISSDGVREHRLTDAQWEHSGLAIVNESELKSATKPINLKPDDWNHVRVKVVGNTLTLFVNGDEVATRELSEPANERLFGLFRYSDRTESRVRNLRYRGDWPKTLPAVGEQQLAFPAVGPLAIADDRVAENLQYSLADSIESLKQAGLKMEGKPEQMRVENGALKMELRDAKGFETWPGLTLMRSTDQDAEITFDYSDLKFVPIKDGWGIALALRVELEDSVGSVLEFALTVNDKGERQTRASTLRRMPDGETKMVETKSVTDFPAEGRLRLVRQGTQMHFLIADQDSEQFRWIHSITIGNEKIRSITVHAKASDTVGTASLNAKQLSVKLAQ